ncbi:5'/3'-nucleotidase SurE [Ensifer sp. 2YAB10]|uniref:5'/3'-nucleotidase SurE n=1 Tax=Ensifer TaxID=106591 RepID=UPI000DE4112C|nr:MULTISPECIES: 5'/3'-nucleotidase SurE [Ensifer]MBK5571626.1 5'/3'-nucleotidase SurE [Ensifer sp. SSB1]MBZ7921445.1 5'/3'-nucleotidase SurE [Ensifer adhaerens]UAX93871.1 5'/3'-nucleotidase SurE [Ensifer adhaerens]UAY01506.1 5'/3'-nucleotidase SurE [Ensifer adhaerens]UAY08889.1 5'/3'-nucleotidase SurE [Ensifer adhaerens]
MRILLTNDDGIHAEGLAVLERVARTISDDVWVVAPEADQSGLAHSLTLSEPLRLRQIAEKRFALRGTPTDCVIMAVRKVLDRKPDLVLSGVNIGANMADDVTYSGTVAGAIEGTLQGIRSIALSQAYHHAVGKAVPWDVVETHAPSLIRKLMAVELPDGTLLNVNFPNCSADTVAGIEVTSQGKLDFGLSIDERTDGRGFPYFWLRFGERFGDFRAGTDIHALRENYISVTPLKLDLTDYSVQDRLMRALNEGAH